MSLSLLEDEAGTGTAKPFEITDTTEPFYLSKKDKWWEISIFDNATIVRYGRLGQQDGEESGHTEHRNLAEAIKYAEEMICLKRCRGYDITTAPEHAKQRTTNRTLTDFGLDEQLEGYRAHKRQKFEAITDTLSDGDRFADVSGACDEIGEMDDIIKGSDLERLPEVDDDDDVGDGGDDEEEDEEIRRAKRLSLADSGAVGDRAAGEAMKLESSGGVTAGCGVVSGGECSAKLIKKQRYYGDHLRMYDEERAWTKYWQIQVVGTMTKCSWGRVDKTKFESSKSYSSHHEAVIAAMKEVKKKLAIGYKRKGEHFFYEYGDIDLEDVRRAEEELDGDELFELDGRKRGKKTQ